MIPNLETLYARRGGGQAICASLDPCSRTPPLPAHKHVLADPPSSPGCGHVVPQTAAIFSLTTLPLSVWFTLRVMSQAVPSRIVLQTSVVNVSFDLDAIRR